MTRTLPWAAAATAALAVSYGVYLWRRRSSRRSLLHDAKAGIRDVRRRLSKAIRRGTRSRPLISRLRT